MTASKSEDSGNTLPLHQLHSRPLIATVILLVGPIFLLLAMAISISYGVRDIPISVVWESLSRFNPDVTDHQVIWKLRLPRVVGSAVVGACFAVSGAIMQGMTRNPLADSGLLGLNAGAGFALALCFAFFPSISYTHLLLYSFLGAGLGALLVFGIGSMARGGLSPIRLVLAGAAVSSLLIALSEGLALYFHIGQDIAFWFAGGVAGIEWKELGVMLPWITVALLGAIVISRSITLLSLGEDVAKGLGQRTVLIKLLAMGIVLILAGASVSVVGAVSFVGLLTPHLARYLVGVDYRWIIPCSAILGAILVVAADLAARMINPPYETPIGALIALIGVPFFLYLARKEGRML